MKCPMHLRGFIEPIGIFSSILPGPLDEFFVGYRIKCKCGNYRFSVKKNDRPLVVATCIKCKEEVVLYDTDQYPDATSYDKEGELLPISGPNKESSFSVCVAFEYPEPDNDEEYTDNDISWCYIYGCPNDKTENVFTIISDETM